MWVEYTRVSEDRVLPRDLALPQQVAMSPTNVAVIGVGLVGKELLSQLSRFSSDRFRIVYVSSSSRSRYSTTGISLSSWSDELSSSTDKPDLPSLPHLLKDVLKTGHKTVVVDNTSSDDVAALYPSFLKAGLHIVTPNKKAFSSSLNLYEEIKKASQESGAKFLNEATVGAGLPIVGTLKDLVETGDEVR
jgi:homoserine dehydrogenase